MRPIRTLGDQVLRTACDPVRTFDTALQRLVDDMFAARAACTTSAATWRARSTSTR
ncbi:peptide deformylase [Actinomadura rayongensis]|uniref:peptide deformylase n=1 Tax=Actinomadura rayongensis TaxID=1429076 RepID=UPI001F38A28B|nr:peptide deformylase [Actinomadura rayongensis]